ncbi:MAG: sensor histidine kinase [Elainellaceae cyanobacterium]
MTMTRTPVQFVKQVWRNIDPASLQFRLTVGTILVSVLGIGGIALWMSLRTEQILIGSHKQYTVDIATRFPQDVALYKDVMSTQQALQKAVDFRSLPNLTIVVADTDGAIRAQSRGPQQNGEIAPALLTLSTQMIDPHLVSIDDQYFVVCSDSLVIDGVQSGWLYVALNVTDDLAMFRQVVQSLGLATLFAIFVIMVAIAFYVRRSLRPLRQMSQLAETVTLRDLGVVKLHLQEAPTEINELVETCEKMLMRLSRAVEQQQQFIHDISHELRTPLTIVYGYLQSMLRRGKTLTEPQREALETAALEADRTIRILQDLLDLARADSGYLPYSKEPLSLNSLVEELVGMAEQSSGQTIDIDATRKDIKVWADTSRLTQILSNLIDNALKYSGADQPITIKLDQQHGDAIIQVCDRGQGIPLQHQSRIFDRCYRVDEARSRSTGGCGLGLSIVKTLVEGMGGSVTVRSKVNEGSVFTVTLPSSPV